MPSKPETLRRRAAERRATAERLLKEAEAFEMEADEVEDARMKEHGLTAGFQSGTVKHMNMVQRKIRSRAAVDPSDEFMVAVHASFPSLRAFAKKLGVTPQFISQVRVEKKQMPPALAERIEKIIGYPAARWKA